MSLFSHVHTLTLQPRLAAITYFLHITAAPIYSQPCLFPLCLSIPFWKPLTSLYLLFTHTHTNTHTHTHTHHTHTHRAHTHTHIPVYSTPQVGPPPPPLPLQGSGDADVMAADCRGGYLWAAFCNTALCSCCPSSCNFSHGNDPSIIPLPWQPVVNPAWPSPVIQCIYIHLHSLPPSISVSLVLSLQHCKLPLFFMFFFFLLHSPHSVIQCFSSFFYTCVGGSSLLLHKQSIHLHKLMSYFRGQSVRMHQSAEFTHPPWLGG